MTKPKESKETITVLGAYIYVYMQVPHRVEDHEAEVDGYTAVCCCSAVDGNGLGTAEVILLLVHGDAHAAAAAPRQLVRRH